VGLERDRVCVPDGIPQPGPLVEWEAKYVVKLGESMRV
jgi:hypothetical protein